MVRQFYVVAEDNRIDSFNIKHIQYNLYKRLTRLKYVTYQRINILLIDKKGKEDIQIEWDDKKSANLKVYLDPKLMTTITAIDSIAAIYDVLFECLEVLWVKYGWNVGDLKNMHLEIIGENFSSFLVYGKNLVSPDKKYKAEFFCELFPEYTDYYLNFLGKKGELINKIKFLHGHPDPSIVFGFYTNSNWRDNECFLLADINKEIFYLFNVKKDEFSIEFIPTYNSLEECKNFVLAFQANVSHKEMMRLLGMPPRVN